MTSSIQKSWDNKYKRDIENQSKPNPFLKTKLNNFLRLINKNSKILDLGCGTGHKTNFIHKKGFNIIGIDSSKKAITYAKASYLKIQFNKQNILKTNFKQNSFDAIISIAVMHCLKKSQMQKYVKEIKRILKKNGLLFQLVLSSEDQTKVQEKQIEPNTYLGKYNMLFHLFTEQELKQYFKDFEFLELNHNKKKHHNKTIAVYTMVLKKN